MCNKISAMLLWTVVLFGVAFGADQPCHFHLSVNISDAEVFSDLSVMHDGVLYGPDHHFIYSDEKTEEHRRGCICSVKPCMRKCCPVGQGFWGPKCVESDSSLLNPFNPTVYEGAEPLLDLAASVHFGVITGDPCTAGRYQANPSIDKSDLFYLQQNGHLYMPHSRNESQMNYCLDVFLDEDPNEGPSNGTVLALICFEDKEPDLGDVITHSVYSAGMFISIPFLLATFLVYAFVPELRNLHGKSLMCYISGLLISYSVLAPLQFKEVSATVTIQMCLVLAFLGYFSIMASIFWLNIMCFDIWWTFSGLRGFSGSRRTSERKRFLLYSLYGWGVPVFLIVVCAILQFCYVPEHIITPDFGVKNCWFRDWKAEMLFVYTPMLFVVLTNLCLFTITACKIVEIKKETSMLQSSESTRHDQYEKDKQRFKLYLKLFIVMGVNWLAELVSFLIGGTGYWWILTDFFNTMIGVCIFIIFVWKRKVKELIVKRYHLMRYGVEYTKTPTSSQSCQTNTSNVDGERNSSARTSDGIKMRSVEPSKV